jgi:hypothetical protein
LCGDKFHTEVTDMGIRIAVLALILTGCASVQPLSAGGAHVRSISAADAKACRYIQNVTYTETLAGLGKSPGLVHQVGENGLRNAVASVGANAYVSTQADADFFFGHVNYAGEAYQCER